MKYVNQKEYPDWLYITRVDMEGADYEKGRTTTISSSGCGLCSAVMVADRLIPDSNFELKDAIRMSYDCKANHRRGTDYTRFAPVFAEKYGLDLEMTNDPERLRYCLRSGGKPVKADSAAGFRRSCRISLLRVRKRTEAHPERVRGRGRRADGRTA